MEDSGDARPRVDGQLHAPLTLEVAELRDVCEDVREFVLMSPTGVLLPAYTPGAHIRVEVDACHGKEWRAYSLITTDDSSTREPRQFVIAVRRDRTGRGGSNFMHENVKTGSTLQVEPPRNDFHLVAGAACSVLIAGGIGVTPLLTMATHLRAQQHRVRMYYAARSRRHSAYLDELSSILGSNLSFHSDEDAGGPLDVRAILSGCASDDRIYMCGPRPMLEAVLALADADVFPRSRVHLEVFSSPQAKASDSTTEVVLARSGKTVWVGASESILDALIREGCDPLFDCNRGECGVCAVPVLEGEIDHRDVCLSATERNAGNVMQICVSRSLSKRLVLDL